MKKVLIPVALIAAVLLPATSAHAGTPQRETQLLKAMPIKTQAKHELRAAWMHRVHVRRMERRAAARAARAAETATTAPTVSTVPTYVGGGSWADELAAVGFPSSVIPTMLYIIDRESGGDPSAINPTSNACGLTQIYPYQPGCLDPMTNLRMAYAKYRASGLSPWSL